MTCGVFTSQNAVIPVDEPGQNRFWCVRWRDFWFCWLRLLPVWSSLILVACAHAVQYRYDVLTAESGLPQNVIRGVAQTPDGYLWISTLDGLARYDGVHFTLFNKSNTPGIASNLFTYMVNGTGGDLWLTNVSGGLTRFHQGSFHTFTAEDGVPMNSVRGITSNAPGDIWILSEENILKRNPSLGEWQDVIPDQLRMHYEPLYWDNAGFWGLNESGLHIFREGVFSSYALPKWMKGREMWSVAVDENGAVWLAALDGTMAYIAPDTHVAARVDARNAPAVQFRDAHGHVFVIHVGFHLARSFSFVSAQQPVSIQLAQFLEDQEGNLWVGTAGSGLYKLQEQSIDVLTKQQGLADNNIYPVYQDRTGAIWAGAWQAGLSRIAPDGTIQNYKPPDGLPGPLVSALAGDRDGNLWVATRFKVGIFRNGHFEKPFGIVLPEHAVVQAILQDHGGTVWIGTSNGLVLYRDGPSRTLTVADGLASDDVRTIVESPSGDLWIGGYGGLTRVHNGRFTHWTERDGLPSDNLRALFLDSEGVLWIGSYDGGLGRLKEGKFARYRQSDGLFSNGVFQILEDSRSNLWMSSNRGIYRVKKADLDAFAAGKATSLTSVVYGKEDGLLNVECNGGLWPAGIRARDGRLWFPTQDGVAIISPEKMRVNPQPPPAVIERAVLDRIPRLANETIVIKPGQQDLAIDYTALSFIHSEQIRFLYRMSGLDSSWVDAGSRRTAYYSHLPPGRYQFQVIAQNSDGIWGEPGEGLAIRVLAPFYRTGWFVTLALFAIAGLVLAAVRYRVLQLQRAQARQKAFSQELIASQEAERQRIAAELHDSLGQRLVVINNLALLSLRSQAKYGSDLETSSMMEEIGSEVASAIRETREISYNLRPFQLDRLGLTKAVESVVRSVATASGINIISESENIDDAFPETSRIHFYRIVQESMNNIMKHSAASRAEVRITRQVGRVILRISDDGRGFTPGARPAGVEKNGFGLTGMTERAHSLGGELRMRSAPGQGTEITVEFLLAEARHA